MNEYYSKQIKEIPDKDNPFAFSEMYFQGYNLNKEILPKLDFIDWLGLCFFERKLNENEKDIINKLPIIISNLGVRDNAVLAAMNTAYHGAPVQNVLITYFGTSGGFYNGAKEISELMTQLNTDSIEELLIRIKNIKGKNYKFHGNVKNYIGLMNYTNHTPENITDIINFLNKYKDLRKTKWILKNKKNIEEKMNMSINLNMIVASIFYDLKINNDKAEALFMYLFMPFAFTTAIEQKGDKRFPFYDKINEKKD